MVPEGAEVPAGRPAGAGGRVVGLYGGADAAGVAGDGVQFPQQASAARGPAPGSFGHGDTAPGGEVPQGTGTLAFP